MMMAVMVVPMGLGRGFGDTSTDQESCRENGDRGTRLGCIPDRRFFRCQHKILSLKQYCHLGDKWNPRSNWRGRRLVTQCGQILAVDAFQGCLKYLVTECS
jgi:hypothetical protein